MTYNQHYPCVHQLLHVIYLYQYHVMLNPNFVQSRSANHMKDRNVYVRFKLLFALPRFLPAPQLNGNIKVNKEITDIHQTKEQTNYIFTL